MSKQTEDVLNKGMERPVPHQGNSGEKTEDLKELDTAALEDPKLLTSVEERLANLGELTRPSRKGPAAEPEEADDESEEVDELPAKEVDSDKSKQADDSPTLDEKHVLPEAYMRAAVGYGWKEEDVYKLYELDPERALTTLSNIYQTRNRASAEFAAIGRKRVEQQQPKEVEETPKFKPIDAAKLKDQFGEEAEPLIKMLEAQNEALNQLAGQVPKPVKQNQVFESAVEESGVEQQIHGYFESDRMKPWEKIYGKLGFGDTWDDLTPGQKEHRTRVLQKADQIVGGAHLQHVDMKLEEALEAAHLLVTQKYRDEVLIDGIKKQVVQRSKAISLRPSKGTRKPGKEVTEDSKPGARTREQLVTDTQKRLDRLYGQS